MKTALLTIVVLLALAGCGDSNGGDRTAGSAEAAPEASPEAPAIGPPVSGDVPDADRSGVTAAVTEYIDSLNHHDAARVCALFAPGALDLGEVPRRRGGCEASLRASIGIRPPGGAPAWGRTELVEAKAVAIGGDRSRVTATVTQQFSDRKFVSVEDDVIYLERIEDRWLLAKPSGTFYRAVGYPEPPLRALAPPPGW